MSIESKYLQAKRMRRVLDLFKKHTEAMHLSWYYSFSEWFTCLSCRIRENCCDFWQVLRREQTQGRSLATQVPSASPFVSVEGVDLQRSKTWCPHFIFESFLFLISGYTCYMFVYINSTTPPFCAHLVWGNCTGWNGVRLVRLVCQPCHSHHSTSSSSNKNTTFPSVGGRTK